MNDAAATPAPLPPTPYHESQFTTRQSGILAFLLSEVALFSTLITTYVIFLVDSAPVPAGFTTPGASSLSLGLVILNSVFLLSSSGTIYLALKARRSGAHINYLAWFGLTIALGSLFLVGTGYEWYGLITKEGLTISTNSFGSAFYTLIGFHACHVTIGVLVMSILWCLEARRCLTPACEAPEIVSWYWHFVDGVWIVIFTLVYVIGR